MPKYIQVSGLSVAEELHKFIESEALVGLPVSAGSVLGWPVGIGT